ncbi:hypothetical protein JHK82_033252 [Glycine max]|uniref:Uncharacterized protein n=1 Tax=Glycine max TaxID=3847 RepID=A0A0R0H3W4_SOYBN|nr:hypothetical protein JHK85_033976 [Glycine max]KAG4985649.1 hypothetical protein JHK86_033340 [Glycine max]KAG5118832.1 hypothetical protein JHK82_033252 [Glycine max]KAG5139825.1 hypothetical protein JHK84_033593 [Glycine max]KAH1142399.1 hypothetical protein GYH30_033198 [Glycine max]
MLSHSKIQMFLKVRSNALKQNLFIMGASSQMITLASINVLPSSNNKEAIPLEVTLRTMLPCDLRAANNIFHKNVLPVLP